MPRCFFDDKNGHRLVDPAGVDSSAREQGIAPGSVARSVAVRGAKSRSYR